MNAGDLPGDTPVLAPKTIDRLREDIIEAAVAYTDNEGQPDQAQAITAAVDAYHKRLRECAAAGDFITGA